MAIRIASLVEGESAAAAAALTGDFPGDAAPPAAAAAAILLGLPPPPPPGNLVACRRMEVRVAEDTERYLARLSRSSSLQYSFHMPMYVCRSSMRAISRATSRAAASRSRSALRLSRPSATSRQRRPLAPQLSSLDSRLFQTSRNQRYEKRTTV